MLTLRKSTISPSSHCDISLNNPTTMSVNVGTKDTTMVVHFQNAPAKKKQGIHYETYCLFALLVITCRQSGLKKSAERMWLSKDKAATDESNREQKKLTYYRYHSGVSSLVWAWCIFCRRQQTGCHFFPEWKWKCCYGTSCTFDKWNYTWLYRKR